MVACLDQWRETIVGCDDAGLPDQVQAIESASRMLHSVMLDAVAELESRNIATTAGFRNTKQLLAGMLNLSPTEAGTRVTHAGQLASRRALGGEQLAPLLPETAAALAAGEIGPGQVKVITETINAIPSGSSPTSTPTVPHPATNRNLDGARRPLVHVAGISNDERMHGFNDRALADLAGQQCAPPRPDRGNETSSR